MTRGWLALVLVGCGSGGPDPKEPPGEAGIYAESEHWLCHPDGDLGACSGPLDATAVFADGTLEHRPYEPAADPLFDCFYLYPTVSADSGGNADLVPGDEERFTVVNQAARLGSVCRVFAPVYRQVTVLGLFDGTGDWEMGFADVADAWAHYLEHDNDGRGVVLLGHSQGAGMVRQLVAEVVEAEPSQHELLISAWVMGNALSVPSGQDVGGDFVRTPLCTSADQAGCALSWMTFRAEDVPDAGSLFGAPAAEMEFACTHPGALGGGTAELRGVFPTSVESALAAVIGGNTQPFADPSSAPALDTAFFTLPGLVDGSCETNGGIGYLSLTVNADPGDPRADEIGGDFLPGWGLHMIDVNAVGDDLVELAGAQHGAWDAAR